MSLSRDEVIWAYKILLNRPPESEAVIEAQMDAYSSLDQMRKNFINTGEFFALVGQPDYAIPGFLVPEPEGGEIRIKEPTLNIPGSQLATYRQMQEIYYTSFVEKIGGDKTVVHRKFWEWAYIYRVLDYAGLTTAGKRGLVFAVGQEPIPSILASKGVEVLASDGPSDIGVLWSQSREYSDNIRQLWREDLCSWDDMQRNVSFREIDMLDIPKDLRNYDFTWSSCSLEHVGSIDLGLEFIKNSLNVLKPGGIAVHTTEFNLMSNDKTIDSGPTVLFRKRDLIRVTEELRTLGHKVHEWNFWPGTGEHDFHIDYPPFAAPHLKVNLYQYVTTSVGIIIEKAA